MPRIPTQFADLLSPRGRRVLEGRALAGVLKTGQRLLVANGLLDADKARAVLGWLEAHVTLSKMEQPIPPETVWGMTENYSEHHFVAGELAARRDHVEEEPCRRGRRRPLPRRAPVVAARAPAQIARR